jgi:hypothetical protein
LEIFWQLVLNCNRNGEGAAASDKSVGRERRVLLRTERRT